MANPVLTVSTTPFNVTGHVTLTWTNANKGVDWYSWRVYRRVVGASSWTLLKEILYDTPNYTYKDYSAASSTNQEWTVVRVYLVNNVPTEEPKGSTAATPVSDNYWLIHPTDETIVYPLYQVVSDSFSEESEQGELKVIGRGRKIDQGTTWGIKGGLSCQLRDRTGLTARAQLLRLRLAKETQWFFWLRTPFGDVWRVVIGDISGDRIAGVGMQEFVDVSFSYTEVAA